MSSESDYGNNIDGITLPADLSEHICKHLPCKCSGGADYCGEFCLKVEESSDDCKCGCGHMACDATKQMGNESTFAATGA